MAAATLIRGPHLFQLANDQFIVWWETDIGDGPNKIQWWKAATDPVDVPAITTGFLDQDTQVTRYVHRAKVTGLTAGVRHYVKLFSFNYETPSNAAYSFSTYHDDGQSVKLGVWGNNGSNSGSTLPGLGNTLAKFDALGMDGYLTPGGICGNGASYSSWTNDFAIPMGTRLQTRGLSGSRGESDGYTSVAKAMFPLGSDSQSQDYFAISVGKARIVGLNSNPGKPRSGLRVGKEQANWLLNHACQDPAWKDASYRILLAHHPFRTTYWNDSCTYGASGTLRDLQQTLHELVKLSGTDLVIYGNSHSYQRGSYLSTFQDNAHTIHHLVVGGGGSFKHNNRCFEWPPPSEPSIIKDTSDYVVVSLDVSSTRLLIEAHNLETGEIFDSISVAPHALW